MTTTDEFLARPASAAPGTAPRGPLRLDYAHGLEDQRAAARHRRRRALIREAAAAFGLALAAALALAWEADRWLTDLHYGADDASYVLPDYQVAPEGGALMLEPEGGALMLDPEPGALTLDPEAAL